MFRVPSSSPPSTPDSRRSSRNVPSTTPAGPPPDRSIIQSSTPAGPPPTGLFGNSQFTVSNPKALNFNRSGLNSSPPKNELFGLGSGAFGVPTSARPGSQRARSFNNSFRVPSSPPEADNDDHDEDAEGDSQGEEEEDSAQEGEGDEDDEDEEMDEDAEEDASEDDQQDGFAQGRSRLRNKLDESVVSRDSMTQQIVVRSNAKQDQYALLKLAKNLAPNIVGTTLREPDEVILVTERLMEKLHDSVTNHTPERRGDVLGDVAQELLSVWKASSQSSLASSFSSSARSKLASPIAQANRLANLLLGIHHPLHVAQRQRSAALSLVPSRPDARHFVPIPKVLLDWLNDHHHAISEVALVMRESRGFSAHENFWDAVQASAFRGNLSDTLKLLRGANFAVAETAANDGLGDDGYVGEHLDNTNRVVRAAINLLEQSPAVQSEDWDVKGQDWSIFRQRVHQVYKDLQEFAEGDSQNRHSFSQSLQASHFGISQSQNNFNLSVASRKAESKVPWSIYENLSRLYRQLLGDEEEIISLAADWVEAVIGLAVWWNGDEEEAPQGSLAASRRSIARSQRIRTVDVTPVKAYCQRLRAALATVIESNEEDFGINVTDRSEVGLACIFDDNIEGVLQILRSWSLTVACAVAEVASTGNWIVQEDGILDQFDQSDLMVFSYTEEQQQRKGLSKDELLEDYANQLAQKEVVRTKDSKTVREGWELATQVLGRLDDLDKANVRIQEILSALNLESSERVDKITQLCHSMGRPENAQHIALKYADHLRDNTKTYGDTLLYYARAHSASKIQEIIRVLIGNCIVQSIAYPTFDKLDESLKALIASPKQTLTKLASYDSEGARLLSTYLSGYATIRKFYDLRDEEILVKEGEKPAHSPMARKRAAANNLIVIISSAASCIRGGLYDPEVETAVQVEVLFSLLGETLVFINQPKRTFTLKHLYSLLAAVEDLDTAPSMIKTACQGVLSSTLSAAHEGRITSPHSLLQKSTSNLTTASSQYSLIGSTEFGSADGQSIESSAVLAHGGRVDDKLRAWDWRKGFAKDATGSDIIRVLRLGIAREMGRAFAE